MRVKGKRDAGYRFSSIQVCLDNNTKFACMMYKSLYVMEVVDMGISASDVVPLSAARAHLSELAEAVTAGAEKIITKNGESYVALIDARRLDYYHRLEREHIHLLLIDEASKGLDDIAVGRVSSARDTLEAIKKRRAA